MREDKLISTKELKDWINNWINKDKYYHPSVVCNSIPLSELDDIIDQLPTVEAIPVKHIEGCIKAYAQEEPYDMYAVGVLSWLIAWWRELRKREEK